MLNLESESEKAVDKYTEMVKDQLSETKQMSKTFENLQSEFDAVCFLSCARFLSCKRVTLSKQLQHSIP